MTLALIFIFANCIVYAEPENKKSIEINVPARTLSLYDSGKLIKKYPVCVGKASTQTPLGEYKVIYKAEDPYWLHEGKLVPPGPENPLGIRWIGIRSDIGVHGNASPESIGTVASGGCIRMYNKDVEELYSVTPIKTPLTIKYDRLEIFDDGYGCTKAAIIYPDIYNHKDSKALMTKIKAEGIDGDLLKRAEALLAKKTSRTFAVSEGTGIFLNNQLITCDAVNKNGSIFVNAQAASEIMGLSPQMVKKLAVPVYENAGKVYINMSDAVQKLKGKLEYDKTTGNAYISLKLLKVNGVYLSSSCGNFDKEYYLDVASLKELGYDMTEDKVEISVFGQNMIKIIRNSKASVALDSLMRVFGATKEIDSYAGIIDLKMPTVIKYGDTDYQTASVGDHTYIKKEAADELGYEEDPSISVFNYKDSSYIDVKELLKGYDYETNEYCSVVNILDKKQL